MQPASAAPSSLDVPNVPRAVGDDLAAPVVGVRRPGVAVVVRRPGRRARDHVPPQRLVADVLLLLHQQHSPAGLGLQVVRRRLRLRLRQAVPHALRTRPLQRHVDLAASAQNWNGIANGEVGMEEEEEEEEEEEG